MNLTLSSPTNASLGTPTSASVTIVDDDNAPPPPPSGYDEYYSYDALGNLISKANVAYSYGTQNALCPNGPLSKPHAAVNVGSTSYCYDQNGNLVQVGLETITWDAENRPTSITRNGVTENYTYDADGERVKRVNGTTTTVYLGGLWEEVIGGATKSYYSFNGQIIAVRDTSTSPATVTYLHSDHLGSISLATDANLQSTRQDFDPWGKRRGTSTIGQTARNYTGQYLDESGLLYYHACYYDPNLARFVSADSIVPGMAIGSGGGAATLGYDDHMALTPLTVDFHEPGFVATLNGETAFTQAKGFWFQLSTTVVFMLLYASV